MANIDLTNILDLQDRNTSLRQLIFLKKYDITNEDELCRIFINTEVWSNRLLIRYNFGHDLEFYDPTTKKLYNVELVSHADKKQLNAERSGISVTVTEYLNGEIKIEEKHTQVLRIFETSARSSKPQRTELSNASSDLTKIVFNINGDTLESERIIDYEPNSGTRNAFRTRVEKVARETTVCTKYYLLMKNVAGEIIMSEMHDLEV
jgi:hypothetical protein